MSLKKEQYMIAAVKISLTGNVVLFIIKAVTLIFINSIAVMTDLGISLAALIVSIVLFYVVRIANKPADILHNYGYGKIEHVCEAMEGLVIIGIGVAMINQAFTGIMHPEPLGPAWVGLMTSAMGIIINTAGGLYILRMAKVSGSPSIRAEALHYFLEAFISCSITASFFAIILLKKAGHENIASYADPVTAIFVSLVIMVPSFKLAREAFLKLLDTSIEEPSKLEVMKCLSAHFDKYCEFKDIKTRVSGTKKFIELKIVLPEHVPFKRGHKLVEILENDIKANVKDSEVMVKMEPCRKDCAFARENKECPYL